MWAQLLSGFNNIGQQGQQGGTQSGFGFNPQAWGNIMGSMGPSSMPQQIPWASLAAAMPDAFGMKPIDTTAKAEIPSIGGMQTAQAQIPSIQGQPSQPLGWLEQMKAMVSKVYPDNPTMQQVALAQAALESGNGQSGLAQQNNLFGIKAGNTAPGTGLTARLPTNEYANNVAQTQVAPFSTNNSPEDSFLQHRNLLTKAKRYAPVIEAQDPTTAFAALQKAGYATDPQYAQKLNAVWRSRVAPLYSQGG